jgi:hypothetical protein
MFLMFRWYIISHYTHSNWRSFWNLPSLSGNSINKFGQFILSVIFDLLVLIGIRNQKRPHHFGDWTCTHSITFIECWAISFEILKQWVHSITIDLNFGVWFGVSLSNMLKTIWALTVRQQHYERFRQLSQLVKYFFVDVFTIMQKHHIFV